MAKQTNNVFSTQFPSGIAFVGLILLGIGIGMLTGQMGAFTIMGIAAGFIVVAIMSSRSNNTNLKR